MKRWLALVMVAAPAALVALLWTPTPVTAQPVPPPGLRVVTHGSAFTGSGTVAAPLNLVPQACGGGSAVSGWGSDGTPTCVSAGGTPSTAVVLAPLSGTVYGSNLSLDACPDGQIYKSNAGIWTCSTDADSGGDITGVTTSGILTGGCTSGTCALDTSITGPTILGRTGGTGATQQLTGAQATALLDAFTSSLKGLAPASGGGTSNYLRADGSWAIPPGSNALVTANVVPKGNGTTQVVSQIFDDGTVVTVNPLEAFTGVGGFNLKLGVQGPTTPSLLIRDTTANTEGGTLVNGGDVYIGGFAGTTTTHIYAGNADRMTVSSSGVTMNQVTVAARHVLDSLGLRLNSSTASPTTSQVVAWNNGTSGGAISSTVLGVNNSLQCFDVDYGSSIWTARDTSWSCVAKHGGELKFIYGSGTTAGSNITSAVSSALSAAALRIGASGAIFNVNISAQGTLEVVGNAQADANLTVIGDHAANNNTTLGTANSNYVNSRATLAFSGTDVSTATSGCSVVGEAQTFKVTRSTGGVGTCTVDFNRTFNSAPYCVATIATNKTFTTYIGTTSTTQVTISFSDSGDINVFCPDRR